MSMLAYDALTFIRTIFSSSSSSAVRFFLFNFFFKSNLFETDLCCMIQATQVIDQFQ